MTVPATLRDRKELLDVHSSNYARHHQLAVQNQLHTLPICMDYIRVTCGIPTPYRQLVQKYTTCRPYIFYYFVAATHLLLRATVRWDKFHHESNVPNHLVYVLNSRNIIFLPETA